CAVSCDRAPTARLTPVPVTCSRGGVLYSRSFTAPRSARRFCVGADPARGSPQRGEESPQFRTRRARAKGGHAQGAFRGAPEAPLIWRGSTATSPESRRPSPTPVSGTIPPAPRLY